MRPLKRSTRSKTHSLSSSELANRKNVVAKRRAASERRENLKAHPPLKWLQIPSSRRSSRPFYLPLPRRHQPRWVDRARNMGMIRRSCRHPACRSDHDRRHDPTVMLAS
eukprot:141740-Prorocentrum_minimum.AAC.1